MLLPASTPSTLTPHITPSGVTAAGHCRLAAWRAGNTAGAPWLNGVCLHPIQTVPMMMTTLICLLLLLLALPAQSLLVCSCCPLIHTYTEVYTDKQTDIHTLSLIL